jgi:hypothetical protein
MGALKDAISNLDKAAKFWAETPTSPFAHNEDLTIALLIDGQLERARAFASDSVRRTGPWPRPKAHALHSLAEVLQSEGRLSEAIKLGQEATGNPNVLGAANSRIFASLIECLFLDGRSATEIGGAYESLTAGPPVDPRLAAEVAPALAIAEHVLGHCKGECQKHLHALTEVEATGAGLLAKIGRVKLMSLALDHRSRLAKRQAWMALANATAEGILAAAHPWVRRFAPHAHLALSIDAGADLLARLMKEDSEGWRDVVTTLLPLTEGPDRATLLAAV